MLIPNLHIPPPLRPIQRQTIPDIVGKLRNRHRLRHIRQVPKRIPGQPGPSAVSKPFLVEAEPGVGALDVVHERPGDDLGGVEAGRRGGHGVVDGATDGLVEPHGEAEGGVRGGVGEAQRRRLLEEAVPGALIFEGIDEGINVAGFVGGGGVGGEAGEVGGVGLDDKEIVEEGDQGVREVEGLQPERDAAPVAALGDVTRVVELAH